MITSPRHITGYVCIPVKLLLKPVKLNGLNIPVPAILLAHECIQVHQFLDEEILNRNSR